MARPSSAAPNASRTLPPFDTRIALAVVIGGAAGSVLRAQLSVAWPHDPAAWPWATFAVNLLGAALLGVIGVRLVHLPRMHGLLGTGLCGGLTTFSTLQLEVVRMVDAGAAGLAAAYLLASLAGGLGLAAAAAQLALHTPQGRTAP